METLCKIRDIYRSIIDFEIRFEKCHNLSLNEGMLLCSLMKEGRLSSGEIAFLLRLTTSNTSKVIRSAEEKGLIERELGDKDKRQMYFVLTPEGRTKLEAVKCEQVEIPELLKQAIGEIDFSFK